MVNLSAAQKHQLATYRNRLSRVVQGEVWGSDYPGPYTPEEKAAEIAQLKSLINTVEAGVAVIGARHGRQDRYWRDRGN
jgi:hypothetical protein